MIIRLLVLFLIQSILYCFAYSQTSQTKANFLIIENVEHLIIYNKLQQRIIEKEKKLFERFVPLKIIDNNLLLNDNYTTCVKVELRGSIYYILKQDENTISNEPRLGFIRYFKNVDVLMDTIQLLSEHVELRNITTDMSNFVLRSGDKLFRFFKDRDLVYLQILKSPFNYGWLKDKEYEYDIIHRKEKEIIKKPLNNKIVLAQVQRKIDEMNNVLADLYGFFNKRSQVQMEPPTWENISVDDKIIYAFQPSKYARYYTNSIQRMINNLNTVLTENNYSISYSAGKIVIMQKVD